MLPYKTWIELDSRALRHNVGVFRKLLAPKTKLWAVVKSNAYGHGLLDFSKLADEFSVDGFCVDSVPEALKLRQAGIKKPILVLGPTLSGELLDQAAQNKITVTVSNFEALKNLTARKKIPEFHLKIDTGMHRQGFYIEDLKNLTSYLLPLKSRLKGIYTHFAAAKDLKNQAFTKKQFAEFLKATELLENAGFHNLQKHCSATGAALLDQQYHLDAVRIGAGLYGIYPSEELENQLGVKSKDSNKIKNRTTNESEIKNKIILRPVLSWHSLVSEIKSLKKGDAVGYDLTEKITKPTTMAIVPIGYWHGFDRGLSKIGEVLIGGRRCRVLGRVSMDLICVDIAGVKCQVGDQATIIGTQNGITATATAMGKKISTSAYEILTRINPLIKKIIRNQ